MRFSRGAPADKSRAARGDQPMSPPTGRSLGQLESEALKLWYEESLQSRRDAVQILDELRLRAGTFLTVIALTTTLLVALSTTRSSRPIMTRPLELAALSLFGVAVLAMSFVLTPWFKWHFYPRPGIVRRMVERGFSADEILDRRARKIPKDVTKDMGRTVALQWIFIIGIVSFLVEMVCWALSIL